MGVLDWLDPTRTWPAVAGPAPALNRLLFQFDALHFGAPIDAARVIGRPDSVNWKNRFRKDCELFYASKGLRLRFREGKLCEVTFLIAPSGDEPAPFTLAQPVAPDGTRLDPHIDRDQIVALFGEADPGGSDEETLQIFHKNGVASDFDFSPTGHLIRWSLYPDD
jgi:hypothetical protein